MNKFKQTLLSILLFMAIAVPVIAQQPNKPQSSKASPPESASILESILSLFKSPENRLITRGDQVCPISPGNLGEQVIWSDRPLFIWQGKIPQSKINLYSSSANFNYEQDEQLLWTETVSPNSQTIAYAGKPLQPGFTYDWEFISAGKTYRPTFILMAQSQRDAIAAELKARESKLKANGGTDEEQAIALADFFIARKLWSDALQQLYAVKNPSPNLTGKIQEIENYLCQSN
jgi:hypothetical protein